MASYPIRVSVDAIDPGWASADPVENPKEEVSPSQLKALTWTACGAAAVSDLAWAVVRADGTLASSGEAWDSRGNLVPATARTSTGVYTLTYQTSYNDETATLKPLVLAWVSCVLVQSLTLGLKGSGTVALVAGTWVVTIALGNGSNAPVNAQFFVGVR